MPGMIDTHWHTMLAAIPQMTAMTADLGYLYYGRNAGGAAR
jgi:imidazolonepropionase-like amidohydrolase